MVNSHYPSFIISCSRDTMITGVRNGGGVDDG